MPRSAARCPTAEPAKKTEYRQININPSTQEGLVLGYLYITQDEADNFRLVSTSFNEIPLGENEINPPPFRLYAGI